MTTWTAALPYFSETELACKCCKVIKLDVRFAVALPALRQKWGKPFSTSSVCRCPTHNVKEGGHPRSLHLTDNPSWPTAGAAAADVKWRNWPTVEKIAFARLAHSMGLRVGLHDGFCHVDLGTAIPGVGAKPFVYGTWSSPFSPEDVF